MNYLKTVIALLFLSCRSASSQVPQKIKVKKQNEQIYFYQKGNKTDTITGTSGNIFYLVVNEAAKGDISLFIENGQLLKTANDSLYIFRYVKGMSYECVFKNIETGTQKTKPAYEYKVLINGVTNEPANRVIIRLKEKDETGYLIENKYYYKDK